MNGDISETQGAELNIDNNDNCHEDSLSESDSVNETSENDCCDNNCDSCSFTSVSIINHYNISTILNNVTIKPIEITLVNFIPEINSPPPIV